MFQWEWRISSLISRRYLAMRPLDEINHPCDSFGDEKEAVTSVTPLESVTSVTVDSNPYPVRDTAVTQRCDNENHPCDSFGDEKEAVSLSQAYIRETARQWAVIVIYKRFEGVSALESQRNQARNLKIAISSTVTDYSKELLLLCTPSAKKNQEEVMLPIPSGFDLPDREQIYRTAYDLWQPVRDKMPAWVKYMSLRKAHQNGDKSLAQAHKDAEQAYYVACQQCLEFQYYTQVRQKLFPAPKAIDWEAQDHKRSA